MKKIGIIGSIGSGKSYISELLRDKGKIVIDLDSVAKSFYHLENVRSEMMEIFGDDIYVFGELANKKLAEIIFNDDEKLERVEKLLKSYILEELFDEFYYQEYHAKQDVIFVESATMMKTGLYREFDEMIIVDAPYFLRKNHVVEERGITEEDFDKRNKIQMKLCDIYYLLEKENIEYTIVDNNYTNDIMKEIDKFIRW